MEPLLIEYKSICGNFDNLKYLINQYQPVIILDFINNWKALEKWNLEYFKQTVNPEKKVKVLLFCCYF